MASATPARIVAADLLREQRLRSARARDLLRGAAQVEALPKRDRGLVTQLVLGVVRTSGTLDAVIGAHLRQGAHLEPRVRDALRLSAYELLYLGEQPRVAVSQGVELVRRAGRRAVGLANAVLRRVAQEDVPRLCAARERLLAGGTDARDLALVGGLPQWLVLCLSESLAPNALCGLALSCNQAPPVYVAANAARGGAASAERLMRESGIAARPTGLPLSYELDGGGELGRSGLVTSVDLVPADLGAQAVVAACGAAPGERVLEVGQGRGTKSILLENAALGEGGPCEICAIDSEGFKVDVAKRRMKAAGLAGHVRSWVLDACRLAGEDGLPEPLRRNFDLVFVDAPCSGTGTMGRHPEIPWSLDERSVARGGSLPELQLRILSAAAAHVGVGCRLAYATCSVLREEDEDVVAAFLASDAGAGFSVRPPCTAPVGCLTQEGYLRTLSRQPQVDGHFCAVLVRES